MVVVKKLNLLVCISRARGIRADAQSVSQRWRAHWRGGKKAHLAVQVILARRVLGERRTGVIEVERVVRHFQRVGAHRHVRPGHRAALWQHTREWEVRGYANARYSKQFKECPLESDIQTDMQAIETDR